jgi:acyl-CoA hydrolase
MIFRYPVTQAELDEHDCLTGPILLGWAAESCEVHAKELTNLNCVVRHIESADFLHDARCGDIITLDVSFYESGVTSLVFKIKVLKNKERNVMAIFNKIVVVCVGSVGGVRMPIPHGI